MDAIREGRKEGRVDERMEEMNNPSIHLSISDMNRTSALLDHPSRLETFQGNASGHQDNQ